MTLSAFALQKVCASDADVSSQCTKAYTFADFPGHDHFEGKPAKVDIKSDPESPNFRTALSNAAAHGPNFAGSYTVGNLGCGTDCQAGAVIDERPGKVQFIPAAISVAAGFEHGGSQLLIIDAPRDIKENFPDGPPFAIDTLYFEMKDGKLIPLNSSIPQ